MNFDNGQGVKFGVSNYGPGMANAANVCHFQYMGMGEAQGSVKQGVPQMQVERNAFVPPYHNVGLAHLQGNPTQAGFPMGVNMTMSSQMSFNSLPPMDSFGQRFPPNQRINMNYKAFNNWVRPTQNNQTSLPSIGHLWSHFQQQQTQKQSVPPPTSPQSRPHQQNFYPNQQHVQGFQNALTLSPGGQRGQNVSYQFQPQNPVMNPVRMYQNVPQERMSNCLYGTANNPAACPNNSLANDPQLINASVPSPSAHYTNVPGPHATAICNQVTNTTTTITMTNCNATSLTTATSHASGIVPTVVTSMAVSECPPGQSSRHPGDDATASAPGCVFQHQKPRLCDRLVPEGIESCGRDSRKTRDAEESLHIVKIPFGWRRTTENGDIVYYSPSNTRLRSYQEVCKYLCQDGTCKCGLECPLQVERVFSFDSLVDGKLWTVEDMTTEDLTKLCIHKRKIIAMATFQNSRKMSMSREPKSRKVKKGKGKVNSTSYDGLLVSQILSHKGKVLPPLNHGLKHNVPVSDPASSPSNVTSDATVHCKSQALQQPHHPNTVNNINKLLPDPMDDLGPITCQVPAKLDFSKDEFVEDHKNLLQVSAASRPAGQAIFHPSSMSPQGHFGQEQLKHSVMMQQSPSPCASAASPSLANSVQNSMYRQNVPQHFQCQVPMNLQQNPGNIMFQALMQVQNAPAQRFANPPVFEQHNVQGGHFQAGGQGNVMIQQGYPQLSDLTWLDTGKPKTKRPRSKKDKQKLNSILDRTSPCPNVDARQIPQESSQHPSSSSTNASFMENPAAFLAQQTALVHSSLSSTKTDLSQQSLKTPQNSLQNSTVIAPTSVFVTDSKPNMDSPNGTAWKSLYSVGESHTSTDSQPATSNVKYPASGEGDENANCDSDLADKLSNSSEMEESAPEQCCDDSGRRSNPANSDNAALLANAKPNSNEAKDSSSSEESPSVTKSKHSSPVPQQIHISTSTCAATVPGSLSSVVVTSAPVVAVAPVAPVMPNNIVELLAANNMNLSVVQQSLTQAHGEFPASTLLSAAAQAQVSQQNPGVLLGQPMQVSPSIQVSGQDTSTVNSLPEMMAKAGMNTLDQINFQLQQQGNTLMLPQNSSLLAGPLQGGYISPTVQGMPLNMFLPINQPLANTAGLNPAQNVLIGLDPKIGSAQTPKVPTHCRMSGTDSNKGLDGFSDPTVNFPTLFANVPSGSNAFGANMKLPTTSSSHITAGVNAPLLNSQFPFVSMNTPMPPMSLPLVTNVTNSLSQVIPAVGVPQTVLNQQSVAPMLGAVTVPTLNNSVVITNQMPSMHASQAGMQNVTFVGTHPAPVGESDSSVSVCGTDEASSRAASVASNVVGNESVCIGDGSQVPMGTKMESVQQGIDKVVTHPAEVLEPINNSGHVVLLPNPNVPMLQLYGGNNPMTNMQQIMLPGTMVDPQLCQAAVGGGLNLLQMQQMWNNAASGNMTNLNALQLQQLQTLQLQLLLQQIQGMQSLVNQIQLQGTVQHTLAADQSVQQDISVDVRDPEEKVEDGEAVDSEDDECEASPSQDCRSDADKSESVDRNLQECVIDTKQDTLTDNRNKDSLHSKARSKHEASDSCSDASRVKGADRIVDQYSCRNIGTEKRANSLSALRSRIMNRSSPSPYSDVDEQKDKTSESDNVRLPTSDVSFAKARHAKSVYKNLPGDHFGPASSDAEYSVTSTGELVKCSGPDDDIGDETDSIDDDMSLDDLRRGLKRPKTDDDTDMDSASMDNYDEDSMDGLSDGCLQNMATGDVVWGQIRGFPLWPGKLVPDSAADGIQLSPSLEDKPDAVLVMWYGDHTFTRVEPNRLKTWEEGMDAHHKTRRKYRRGRKMNSHLESAIEEAVKDLLVANLEPAIPSIKPAGKGRTFKKKKS